MQIYLFIYLFILFTGIIQIDWKAAESEDRKGEQGQKQFGRYKK